MVQSQKPDALYRQIGSLLATAPNLTDFDSDYNLSPETMSWLGRASALVHAADPASLNPIKLDMAAEKLVNAYSPPSNARQIILILNMVLAKLESQVAPELKGSFVSAGNEFDAIAALANIIGDAASDVLIIDPYMDERALLDFGVLVHEGVQLRLLSDEATHKPGLRPAAERWVAQYAGIRPLAIRLAPARSLHDRLIVIDSKVVWILTQSLKDFAKRSHAIIQRGDPELAKLKIDAFSDLWISGNVIL